MILNSLESLRRLSGELVKKGDAKPHPTPPSSAAPASPVSPVSPAAPAAQPQALQGAEVRRPAKGGQQGMALLQQHRRRLRRPRRGLLRWAQLAT